MGQVQRNTAGITIDVTATRLPEDGRSSNERAYWPCGMLSELAIAPTWQALHAEHNRMQDAARGVSKQVQVWCID